MEKKLRELATIIEAHMPLESAAGEPGDAGCSCGAELKLYTWPGYCQHLAALLADAGGEPGKMKCGHHVSALNQEMECLDCKPGPPAPEGASLTEQKMAIAPLIVGDDDPRVAEKWWNKGRAGGLRDGVKAGLEEAAHLVTYEDYDDAAVHIRALDPEAIAAKLENAALLGSDGKGEK